MQDIRIELHNTRFRLTRWRTPEGDDPKGELPEEVQDHPFGPHLRSYILYQYYHPHVTQPLLLEQRHAFGVDICSGQLARLLTEGHAGFPAETEALLRAGLEVSSYLNVDDTAARHQGKNGYCLSLGSQSFAGYRRSLAKDRLSFITVLWNSSPAPDYRIDAVAVEYLRARGASQWLIDRFPSPSVTRLPDDAAWEAYLKVRAMVGAKEVGRVTEAARLASLVAQGWLEGTVILSDGAGQFAMLQHALCWIHAERALRRLVPPGAVQRQAQQRVLDEVWGGLPSAEGLSAVTSGRAGRAAQPGVRCALPASHWLSCPGSGAQAAASEESGAVARIGALRCPAAHQCRRRRVTRYCQEAQGERGH